MAVLDWYNDSMDLLLGWMPYPFNAICEGCFAVFCAAAFVKVAIEFFTFLRRI